MPKTTHGLYHHPLYTAWNSMVQRCYNASQVGYPEYGGRGITVCSEWLLDEGLAKFIEDMFPTYKEGLTLERKDVDLGYSEGNCCWSDWSNQAYNQRKAKNNKSGKTGVCYKDSNLTKKWEAYIYKDRKKIFLGYYQKYEEAKVARERAELEIYGKIKE